ncbi:MAG: metallophosphoesterase family protein [Bacteroidales bacterium]|nr:metallophosphoesterase family protein [Bacteroidales bacterium]
MKRFLPFLLAVFTLAACGSDSNNPAGKHSFAFGADGTFKIVQITDTHFSTNSSEENRAFVINRLSDVIDAEKPDLIIFTGDNVTSGNLKEMWEQILKMVDSKGIPFACVYGNHDREEQLSDLDLPQCFVNDPLCINTLSKEGYLEDMALPIASRKSGKTGAVLYLMDSGDYSPVATHWDYGWITHDQVHWYVEHSRAFAKANSNKPVPSYAFFHIPLNEFYEAYSEGLVCGGRGEPECPGELNSGLMSAFEENGDVHAIFVGHDHDNDYVARIGGIACVYGRCCFNRHDGRIPADGTRVIELKEGDYGFRTWVREIDKVVDDIHFDVPIDFTCRMASKVSGLEPGLCRTMYSEVLDMVEMESTAKASPSEIVPTPRITGRIGQGNYGAVQEGYVYIPETGAWSFHCSIYDEGKVIIDDIEFGPTDYGRGQVKYYFEKGYHPVKIYMKTFNGNNCWCKLMWRNQYNARYHEIPADYFFHK